MNFFMDFIVIIGVVCMFMGGFQGDLVGVEVVMFGVIVIGKVLVGLDFDVVQEIIMGCVLFVGQGQVLVWQVVLVVGLLLVVGVMIVNKMCGLGMKVVMLGYDLIFVGFVDVVVVGGMESMLNVLYLLLKVCGGYCMGYGQVIDYMFFDGFEDVYDKGCLMGSFVEDCVQFY